jgi:Zn-finger nucleic acid-binding protein
LLGWGRGGKGVLTTKSKKPEDEYFARRELQRREEEAIRRQQEEREARRKLHLMKCPKCGGDLSTTRFRAVEVDRCGECSGVWLDKGELERLAGHDSHFLQHCVACLAGKHP